MVVRWRRLFAAVRCLLVVDWCSFMAVCCCLFVDVVVGGGLLMAVVCWLLCDCCLKLLLVVVCCCCLWFVDGCELCVVVCSVRCVSFVC